MDWLLEEILTGLQKLSLLRLANSPATDDEIEGCARAWIEALAKARDWKIEDRDAIRSAFRVLLAREPQDGRAVFWPAPGDFLAHMPKERVYAAPYHQDAKSDRPIYALSWDKNNGNRSLTAKAHCTYNCKRLGLDVPAWAMPESDAESEAILRLIESIHDEQKQLRKDHGIPERKEAADVVRDSNRSAGAGEALPDVPGPDHGPSVEGRDALGEAVGEDEYGEYLSRRASRVDPALCQDWSVYKGAA